jgi:hypothetical protein
MITKNRAIKVALEAKYGRGKVTVRGARGTAYGWVQVHVKVAPRDRDHYRGLRDEVYRLIAEAGIKLDTYDSGDYGSGQKMNISFEPIAAQAA